MSRLVRAVAVVGAISMGLRDGAEQGVPGHHWLTDVAVGWTLRLAWVASVVTAHRLYLTFRRHQSAAKTAA